MELTNREKTDAINEAYTKRTRARENYAELADIGDEDAQRKLRKIDRDLQRLRQEAVRLAAQRSGSSAGEGDRYRDAVAFTATIEDEFFADLARMGWYQQPSAEVRREIKQKALQAVRDRYGEHAAEHCREHIRESSAGFAGVERSIT